MKRPAVILSLCLIPLLLDCSTSGDALSTSDAGSGGAMATSDGQAASPDTQAPGGGAGGDTGGAGGGGAGGSAGTGGAGGAVSCDQRKVICKRAAPVCPFGQAPAVVDGCYGDCVSIHACACESAADCPDQNQYTCFRNTKRCGPYIY